MDFETDRLYYSHQQLHLHAHPTTATTADGGPDDDAENDGRPPEAAMDDDDDHINMDACRRHFREFLSTFMLCSLLDTYSTFWIHTL
jgi:hypothetical protein